MQIDFTPDDQLYPFTSRWFESSRGRMHYLDEGVGPTILFCHGNPTWSFLYRDIIIALRDRFRCVAMDYLGFGLSERPAGYDYAIEVQAGVVGELVDHLNLDGYVSMGQDWGGPISMAVATARAERVAGIVLGNTWFWPPDAVGMKIFSKALGTGFMQRQILEKNFFVERLLPMASSTKLSPEVMAHYRGVQPNPQARKGVAMMPKQILGARSLLERLAREVPAKLGSKPTLLVWGMKDFGFRAPMLARMRDTFGDHVVVELPEANHFIQEDAPAQIAQAIVDRFGT